MRALFLTALLGSGCSTPIASSQAGDASSNAILDASAAGDASASSDLATHIDLTDASVSPAVDQAVPSGASTLPAAVIAAGYTQNTFDTPSFSATNVDLKKTKATGFQWYPFSWGNSQANLANIVPNSDGSLGLAGDTTGPNGEIMSAIPTTGGKFVGTTFGGGAYFEATLKFNPQPVIDADFKMGWPSWWALPIEHILQQTGDWWNADPSTDWGNFVELDFFEYDDSASPATHYDGTLHNWYGVYKTTCAGYCDASTRNTNTNVSTVPTGTDFDSYHSAGFLWIPATATKPGSATFYFDRQVVGTKTTWEKWVNQPVPTGKAPATPQPTWAFSWMDTQHYVLILGTGPNEPMVVKSVSVWQASAASNQHD